MSWRLLLAGHIQTLVRNVTQFVIDVTNGGQQSLGADGRKSTLVTTSFSLVTTLAANKGDVFNFTNLFHRIIVFGQNIT